MKNDKKIAVVIPCYQVAQHIIQVLASLPKWVDFIIVVDDACSQQTGNIIATLNQSKTYVLLHKKNQGVGGAMITGYKKALQLNADIIIKMDGDGQMDSNYLTLLLQPLLENKADYTKGNRFNDFDTLKRMPKLRLFGNSMLSFMAKIASGYWNIMDPTNGFVAISRQSLAQIDLNKIAKRYFFEIDMLVCLNLNNSVVKDVAIPAKYGDEKSNLNILSVMLEFPFKILKKFIHRIFYQYFILDFNMASIYLLLGFPMLVLGSSYGIYRLLLAIFQQAENSAGTIMLAALPIILGTQFLLQAISIDISKIPNK